MQQRPKLLIISNNPLSSTRNNGKTLLSYIDACDHAQVRQLYFYAQKPEVAGYHYFQITNQDVIKGRLCPKYRGRAVDGAQTAAQPLAHDITKRVARNEASLWVREALWFHGWKSKQLIRWLDDFSPTAVFFVAGDALFAYAVCRFIVRRFDARLTVYVTDDYFLPGRKDSLLTRLRKSAIKRQLKSCLALAKHFYTVSEPMRQAYQQALGRDSLPLAYMSESLRDEAYQKEETELVLVYAGSLYYGRAALLGQIGQAVQRYNAQTQGPRALLKVYSSYVRDEALAQAVCVPNGSVFCGALDHAQIKERLNTADILVFAESFAPDQLEKTRYSLSTKAPEYLSLGKPILAVGPAEGASMRYLAKAALCVHAQEEIAPALHALLADASLRTRYGAAAQQAFASLPDKQTMQQAFLKRVLGSP